MIKKATRPEVRPNSPGEYDLWYFDPVAAQDISVPAEQLRLTPPGGRLGVRHREADQRGL
jgi:hypothetical protein